jgi:small subunit ribosomal protein S8
MSMNDPIADMLTRIRNGQRAFLPKVTAPASNKLAAICDALAREGYIRGYQTKDIGGNKKELHIELKYFEGQPVIKELKRVSKCGRREYSQVAKMPKVRSGLGTLILSTSKGVLSDFEARQQHVGGEVICSVF